MKHKFKNPNIDLEVPYKQSFFKCDDCGNRIDIEEFEKNLYECQCGKSNPIPPRMRIHNIADDDSFVEHDENLLAVDVLEFPYYGQKLISAKETSGENDAVVTGEICISGTKCCIFVMDTAFLMGSMGVVVGEKITRLFEFATQRKLPLIGFCASGGARMQEGIFSLMQMAKVSGAVKRHSDAGLLYVSVLTNPTTGGVTASFAMEGDIILAEPKSLIAFAGPRVIAQTIRQKIPRGFQSSEFVLQKGFVDAIVKRVDTKAMLKNLLRLHNIS